jgi:ABC-type polysaccharide/polyol phosphate export permease
MRRFVTDLKKYFKYAVYSAKCELKAEVASSYLNWIWWILEPICFMFIYAFIFGYVFNAREEYFPVFIYVGLTFWEFFNKNMKSSVKMVKRNKGIVSKVYLPKFILIISKMLVNGFKMLVSCGIIVLLIVVFRVPLTWRVVFVIPLVITLWLICFGLMCILMHFGVYVEDLANVVDIALKVIFYMTGIFYSIETRIGNKFPQVAAILGKWNPIAFIISSLRKCIIYEQRPSLKLLAIWFVLGILVSVLGVRTIYKNENSYVKVI